VGARAGIDPGLESDATRTAKILVLDICRLLFTMVHSYSPKAHVVFS
jgi:hypothetical protein